MIMIVKERKIPLTIQKLEALLRRLPHNHSKREEIQRDLFKRKAGFRGEESLDYYLSELDYESFSIFHDVRLSTNPYYFQIDTLILTNFFAAIIEVKNISGILHFDPSFSQLLRTNPDGVEEGFPDPFSQVEYQKKHLEHWFHEQKLPIIPIETLIVISNPATIIKTLSGTATQYRKLCHTVKLVDKIVAFKDRYKNEVISGKERRKIHKVIMNNQIQLNSDVLNNYGISLHELINGVQCPTCSKFPMTNRYGGWNCPYCNHFSKKAHEAAIEDFFLLINPTITNSQLREFTHLSSRHTARRILTSMPLQSTGSNRGRAYHSSVRG